MSDSQFDKSARFNDWIRHLRYWLAMKNIPDREKIRIEVIFPDGRAQHYAWAELMRELDPLTAHSFNPVGEIGPESFEFEGVKVAFTNPERWDKRRP
jgi:hypothetical protein